MSSARTSINWIERWSCTRWTSSSTSRNGSDLLARTLPSRGRRMLARSACDIASAEKVRRSSASTESSASATYARSADGSLSSSVIVSHANGRSAAVVVSLTRVVLPYPGGATTSTTVASLSWSCAASFGRGTTPGRSSGRRSLISLGTNRRTRSRSSSFERSDSDASWIVGPATVPAWPVGACEVKGREALERELLVRLLGGKQLELLEQ